MWVQVVLITFVFLFVSSTPLQALDMDRFETCLDVAEAQASEMMAESPLVVGVGAGLPKGAKSADEVAEPVIVIYLAKEPDAQYRSRLPMDGEYMKGCMVEVTVTGPIMPQ